MGRSPLGLGGLGSLFTALRLSNFSQVDGLWTCPACTRLPAYAEIPSCLTARAGFLFKRRESSRV
eukprot:4148648-Amphidinium_carterae.2